MINSAYHPWKCRQWKTDNFSLWVLPSSTYNLIRMFLCGSDPHNQEHPCEGILIEGGPQTGWAAGFNRRSWAVKLPDMLYHQPGGSPLSLDTKQGMCSLLPWSRLFLPLMLSQDGLKALVTFTYKWLNPPSAPLTLITLQNLTSIMEVST